MPGLFAEETRRRELPLTQRERACGKSRSGGGRTGIQFGNVKHLSKNVKAVEYMSGIQRED